MTMSATLYVNQSSVQPGTPVNVTVKVSNSGAGAVSVTGVRPVITPIDAASAVSSEVTPRPSVSIGAGATRGFGFTVMGFSPQQEGADQAPYTIGAVVTCSDGTVIDPERATVQVSSPFDDMPETDKGHLRFDSNFNSGLLALR